MVGGISLPRMIIGSNWLLGWSHRSPSADGFIISRNKNKEAIADIICAYLRYGINAVMSPHSQELFDGIKLAEDRAGKKVHIIYTPVINVDDTAEARKEAEAEIKCGADNGAAFCLPHHYSVEQLVNKNKRTIKRLPDYLSMVRTHGMLPGVSAHMPELIQFSDEQGYDVETYIQIYNCMGFLMQMEIELIHDIIHNAKKPVITIKPMAAGRVTPFVGITFSFATLRECDMVTVGCLTPEEVHEDVEIGLAAIERRKPDLEGRASPKSILD